MKRHILEFCLVAAFVMTSCGVENIIHGLSEREANQIVELLADHQMSAQKIRVDNGRTTSFNIAVAGGSKVDAIRLLNRNELPRRRDRGYMDVFVDGGLIPTSAEEKAKKLAALEGEIERQLKLVDGVLDAQVQIVIPNESALRTSEDQRSPTTASVTLRYLPGAAGRKPLSEAQVQALVAAGVEGLTADRVYPLLTPIARSVAAGSVNAPSGASASGSWLAQFSKKQINMITAVVMTMIAILCALLVFWQIRLKKVRGMLIRLQSQIAEARRRQSGTESLPPAQ